MATSNVSGWRRRAVRIGVDSALLVGFLAEFATREGPDYDVHSWIGFALVPLIAVHLVSNWRWLTSTIRRRRSHPEWPLARFNAGFSAATAVCIVSGFPLWFDWSTNDTLVGLHTLTGILSIALAFSHLWRNRMRLASLLRRRDGVAVGTAAPRGTGHRTQSSA